MNTSKEAEAMWRADFFVKAMLRIFIALICGLLVFVNPWPIGRAIHAVLGIVNVGLAAGYVYFLWVGRNE